MIFLPVDVVSNHESGHSSDRMFILSFSLNPFLVLCTFLRMFIQSFANAPCP